MLIDCDLSDADLSGTNLMHVEDRGSIWSDAIFTNETRCFDGRLGSEWPGCGRCQDGCEVPEGRCLRDSDCGADDIATLCEAGECVPSEGRCANSDGCPAGQSCVEDRCGPPIPCEEDALCQQFIGQFFPPPPEFRCLDGGCQMDPPQCQSDAHCGGASCTWGLCLGLQSPECVRDRDCGGERRCEQDQCIDP